MRRTDDVSLMTLTFDLWPMRVVVLHPADQVWSS